MKITRLEAVESQMVEMDGVEGVSKQVPLSKNDGAPNFSFRVFTIKPGGHTPYHRHESEHLNYIIEGEGCVITESGEEKAITKGDFILILPNEKHQYKNTSVTDTFRMICAVPKEYE